MKTETIITIISSVCVTISFIRNGGLLGILKDVGLIPALLMGYFVIWVILYIPVWIYRRNQNKSVQKETVLGELSKTTPQVVQGIKPNENVISRSEFLHYVKWAVVFTFVFFFVFIAYFTIIVILDQPSLFPPNGFYIFVVALVITTYIWHYYLSPKKKETSKTEIQWDQIVKEYPVKNEEQNEEPVKRRQIMANKYNCETCDFKGSLSRCHPLFDIITMSGINVETQDVMAKSNQRNVAINQLAECTFVIPCHNHEKASGDRIKQENERILAIFKSELIKQKEISAECRDRPSMIKEWRLSIERLQGEILTNNEMKENFLETQISKPPPAVIQTPKDQSLRNTTSYIPIQEKSSVTQTPHSVSGKTGFSPAFIAKALFVLFIIGIVVGGSPSTVKEITKMVGGTPILEVGGWLGDVPNDIAGGKLMHWTVGEVTGITYTTKPEDYKLSPKTTTYPYVINGKRGSIPFTTYGGLVKHFAEEDHTYQSDPDKEVLKELLVNDDQTEYLKPFVDEIKKQSTNPDEQAKIAISLVQNIPYDTVDATSGDKNNWYYPYEILYQNKGICSDKSLLLIYLLNELGYDVVYLEFDLENHAAVGIKPKPLIMSPGTLPVTKLNVSRYIYQNTGYSFIETTTPSIITDSFGEYGEKRTPLTSTPRIVDLTNGEKPLPVGQEYNDAISYERYVNDDKLTPVEYRGWEYYVWKYGIVLKGGKTVIKDPRNDPLCGVGGTYCNGQCWLPCSRGTSTCTQSGAVCQL